MKPGRKPDHALRALVQDMLDKGMSQEKIAAHFGVTPASVSVMCSRMGVSATQRGLRKPRGRPPATDTNTIAGSSR